MARLLILLASLAFLESCSSFRRLGLKMASPIFYEASNGLMKEKNWDNFRASVLPNLALIEGLSAVDPHNQELLVTLTKGYAGFSYMVNETAYLHDKLKENEKEFNKKQAIANYSRAIEYGTKFLKLNDIEFSTLQKAMRTDGGIPKVLESELSDDMLNLEGVLFMAHSLAGLINLQRDKILLVSQLPLAKGMFDWVCGIRPDINNGVCDIFYASYEAGRPRMLGGNPEKGKKMFLNMIKKDPENLLARVAFLENYVIPMSDGDLYRTQKRYLDNALNKQSSLLDWGPQKKRDPLFAIEARNIFQAGALEKYKVIKKLEEDLF